MTHRRHAGRAGALLVGAALFSTAGLVALRQEPATGEVYGRVTDTGGGALPGATITVDGRRLAAPLTATSDRTGTFHVPGLAAGAYMQRAQLRGFAAATRENVVVAAGARVDVNVVLPVAPIVDRNGIPSAWKIPAGDVAVELDTARGEIFIAVDTVHAPITAANFLKYVDAGFYDLGRVHRVTRPDNYTAAPPNRPMMEIIQAGADPFRWRDAFPAIPLERTGVTGLRHVTGTVSMARGTAADTATSDFFILLDDQPSLDFGGKRFDDGQGAAAFGRVVAGMDVVRAIQQEQPLRPAPNQQYLENPVVITKALRMPR